MIIIAALIIICLCALCIAIFIDIRAGKRKASENELLLNTFESIKKTANTKTVVLDGLNTITKGDPVVTDVCSADNFTKSGYSVGGYSDDELLEVAALLGRNSDEPLSKAITKYADELLIDDEMEISNFRAYPGNRLEAEMDDILIRCGDQSFIKEKVTIPPELSLRAEELSNMGRTSVFFSKGKRLLGLIAASISIKEDTSIAISELRKMGVDVVLLTSEDQTTSCALAKQAGIDEVVSELLPEGKEEAITNLKKQGEVIVFAQDSLAEDDSLFDVSGSIRLSRAVLRNMHENMLWVALCAILAIILMIFSLNNILGIALILKVLAVIMGVLSFIAVFNAVRFQLFDVRSTVKDKNLKK